MKMIFYIVFSKNLYKKELVNETLSPSMDITVASNFERLIYDFYLERDAETCKNFLITSQIVLFRLVKMYGKKLMIYSAVQVLEMWKQLRL